jgi:hypothetical protein
MPDASFIHTLGAMPRGRNSFWDANSSVVVPTWRCRMADSNCTSALLYDQSLPGAARIAWPKMNATESARAVNDSRSLS